MLLLVSVKYSERPKSVKVCIGKTWNAVYFHIFVETVIKIIKHTLKKISLIKLQSCGYKYILMKIFNFWDGFYSSPSCQKVYASKLFPHPVLRTYRKDFKYFLIRDILKKYTQIFYKIQLNFNKRSFLKMFCNYKYSPRKNISNIYRFLNLSHLGE